MELLTIEHVHIEGIWNKYTVDFPLNRDVNILVGDNGVGKTTILDIIAYICDSNKTSISERFTRAKIQFVDGYELVAETTQSGKILRKWSKNDCEVNGMEVNLILDIVSTFDTLKCPEIIASKINDRYTNIRSELDLMTYFHVDFLNKYISIISKDSRQLLKDGKPEEAEQIYHKYDKMKELCNELYDGKSWYEDAKDGTIMFKTEDNDIITLSQLSSGEKQLLILLISTLVQNGRNVITFWDEPEISLHISWQQRLIRTMRELNPNMQLIIATHSPSILYEGWEQRVINVNDIKSKS